MPDLFGEALEHVAHPGRGGQDPRHLRQGGAVRRLAGKRYVGQFQLPRSLLYPGFQFHVERLDLRLGALSLTDVTDDSGKQAAGCDTRLRNGQVDRKLRAVSP